MNDIVQLLNDYLSRSARRLPHKVGLVCGNQRFTFADILSQAQKLAKALRHRGVRRGDRVLVVLENRFETVVAFWGVLEASAVAVLVNPQTKAARLQWLLQDCGATALIASPRHAIDMARVGFSGGPLRSVLVAGHADSGDLIGLPNTDDFDAAVSREEGGDPLPRECIDSDLAALIYTSGTTGEPKGVMLTHHNMLSAAISIRQYLELRQDDVVLNVLPMAFDYGLYQMILSVREGARLVLDQSFKVPMQTLQRAAAEQVTFLPMVPTMFAILTRFDNVQKFLTTVRVVTSTGSTLSTELIEKIRKMAPKARIFSMYGLTECKRCTYLPPEDLERKPGSIGLPIPNTELWLVDEHDQRIGSNEMGQLVIRGATVMRGYWGKPEETAKTLRPGPLPGELVLYTGDYCRMDDDGYLYFIGRMDDMIKSYGEKVSPLEVEAALYAVEGVKDVAVIGIPDEILGEAVAALVVLEDGSRLTEADLRRECFTRLESFKVPKSIKFRAMIPRSDSGKLIKKELTENVASLESPACFS